jgi:hypothetical protein
VPQLARRAAAARVAVDPALGVGADGGVGKPGALGHALAANSRGRLQNLVVNDVPFLAVAARLRFTLPWTKFHSPPAALRRGTRGRFHDLVVDDVPDLPFLAVAA